jgi:hypothetical protein
MLVHGLLFFVAVFVAVVPPAPDVGPGTLVNVTAQPLTATNAPADEYFGKFKLSNLGIRNIIRAFRIEGNSPLALPIQRARILAVDLALVDWGEKYPRDLWLIGTTFGFADVLSMKQDIDTDAIAINLLLRTSQRFENTKYEKTAIDRLGKLRPVSGVDFTVDNVTRPGLPDLIPLQIK